LSTDKLHPSRPRGPRTDAGVTPSPAGPDAGLTTPSRSQRREPRLPHERDESSDSQAPANADAERVGRQAADDLERGLVDTDRGPVMDRLMREHFRSPLRRKRRPR